MRRELERRLNTLFIFTGQITSKAQKPRQQCAEARPGMQSLEASGLLTRKAGQRATARTTHPASEADNHLINYTGKR